MGWPPLLRTHLGERWMVSNGALDRNQAGRSWLVDAAGTLPPKHSARLYRMICRLRRHEYALTR